MKAEFNEYLEGISISAVMYKAVKTHYDILVAATKIEFEDIHFSDQISTTGIREFFSLWAFAPNLICKISVGQASDQELKLIMFKNGSNLARFTINDYNYDLVNPVDTSYIESTIRTFDMDIPFGIYASGNNCNNLMRIIHKYIIPNLQT